MSQTYKPIDWALFLSAREELIFASNSNLRTAFVNFGFPLNPISGYAHSKFIFLHASPYDLDRSPPFCSSMIELLAFQPQALIIK